MENALDKWKKHVKRDNGKWVTHALCKKITCGALNATLMAHKKLTRMLRSWELKMNPHDPCVWNKIVMKKQLILICHVDDVMLNHLYPQVVTECVKRLDGIYGQQDPLSVNRGLVHEHLGMIIDFRMKGRCVFSQYDAIKKFWMSWRMT